MPNCEICGKTFERNFGGGNLSEGGAAFKCPECAAKSLESTPSPRDERRQAAAQFALELNRIAPARPVVTWALIAVCAAVFGVELLKGASFDTMPVDVAIRLGADYGPLTLTGQWWRLFTSMFLHFGFFHLLMNMWCLWALGGLAERLMGRAAFLLLYVATGLAGGLLSVAVHPQVVGAGASGAVFGVAGGLITYLWLKKAPLDLGRAKKQLSSLGIFVAYNFLYSLQPGVDMMAHVGGLASGLVVAAALPRFLETPGAQTIPQPFQEKSPVNKRIAEVGIACAMAIVIAFFAVRRLQGDSLFVLDSLRQIDAGQSAAVIPKLEQMVKNQPDSATAHFALGAAYLRTNQSAAAVLELYRADTLAPGNAATEHELGVAYLLQEDFDLAITKLRQALADNPNNAGTHLALAGALLGKHQDQEAADEARKVLAVMPKDSEAHAVLGQAEIRLGSTDDGLHEMETALQLDPDNSDLRTRLLAAYMATGHMAQFRDLKTQTGTPDKIPATAPPGKIPNAH